MVRPGFHGDRGARDGHRDHVTFCAAPPASPLPSNSASEFTVSQEDRCGLVAFRLILSGYIGQTLLRRFIYKFGALLESGWPVFLRVNIE